MSLNDLERNYSAGTNPLAYLPLADELRRRRQFDRALEVCHEGIRRNGSSTRAQTILGKIYYDRGQFNEAIEALRPALEQAPGGYEPTLMMARALARSGQYVEARKVLEPLLASHAHDPEVQLLDRFIQAEISQTITDFAESRAVPKAEKPGERVDALRQQIEDLPGVEALYEFGLVHRGGDVFFEELEGQDLDEDIKITLLECHRLAMKLAFGRPRRAILEAPAGRLFFLLREGIGLMAVASHAVKLGRLRFLMEQYLHSRQAAKSTS